MMGISEMFGSIFLLCIPKEADAKEEENVTDFFHKSGHTQVGKDIPIDETKFADETVKPRTIKAFLKHPRYEC